MATRPAEILSTWRSSYSDIRGRAGNKALRPSHLHLPLPTAYRPEPDSDCADARPEGSRTVQSVFAIPVPRCRAAGPFQPRLLRIALAALFRSETPPRPRPR